MRFITMGKHFSLIAVGLSVAVVAGCADPMGQADRDAAAPSGPLAALAPLTPEQEKDKADARQAYMTCLKQAAQYAQQKADAAGDEAALIAPMCYPQFSRFEIAATAGMDSRNRRVFDRDGDKRQLDFAADAIRQDHGLAALSVDK